MVHRIQSSGVSEAAVSVAGNFRDRCVEDAKISTDPSRKDLPIRSFVGGKDEYFGPSGKVYDQWIKVRDPGFKARIQQHR